MALKWYNNVNCYNRTETEQLAKWHCQWLEKGYTLKELSKDNIKEFQAFLNKVSHMTVQQVDNLYSRRPDKKDTYNGMQVYHYEVTRSFRIHVIIEAGYYKIIRLDPSHSVHKS